MIQRSVSEQEKPHWLEIVDLPYPDKYDGGVRMAETIADNLRRAVGEEVWGWLEEVTDDK